MSVRSNRDSLGARKGRTQGTEMKSVGAPTAQLAQAQRAGENGMHQFSQLRVIPQGPAFPASLRVLKPSLHL